MSYNVRLLSALLIFIFSCQMAMAQQRTRVSDADIQRTLREWSVPPSGAVRRPTTGRPGTLPQRYNRLTMALNYVSQYSLTVDQLVRIAETFPNEEARFEILRTGYGGVVDPENFFYAYDVFTRMSLAILLYDYVLHHEVVFDGVPGHGTGGYTGLPDFSGYQFPDFERYSGRIGNTCTTPVAPGDFEYLMSTINRNVDDDQLLAQIHDLTQRNCLATGQVMKLSLFLPLEIDRLQYLKYAFQTVFDIDNFDAAQQVLSHGYYREDLLAFLYQYQPVPTDVVVDPCQVAGDYYDQIRHDIQNQRFSDQMIQKAQAYIQNECLNMGQLRGLIGLFTFDDDRLELMKFMYPYMPNKGRAHTFSDLLTFSSSKQAWEQWVQRQ